jgi:hypothetical protein
VAETDLMPRLVGGNTERCCSKLKSGNRFLKPNFELGPKPSLSGRRVIRLLLGSRLYKIPSNCMGRCIAKSGAIRGLPRGTKLEAPDQSVVLDVPGVGVVAA